MPQLGPTDLPGIDNDIQDARGDAAGVLGQTYDLYRLTGTTNNGIISGTPLYSQYQASIRKTNDRKALENTVFEIQVFEALCDNRSLSLGDILVENPAYYGGSGSAYAVAQKRPRRETILVRCESNVSITRPNPQGGQAGQQPASGNVFMSPDTQYGGIWKQTESLLTLSGGLYSFAATGQLASVPFGLQPQNRARSAHKPDFPTQVPETRFVGYLPLLPGVQIVENDIVNMSNSDRYMVIQPFQTASTGLNGWVLLLTKMAV